MRYQKEVSYDIPNIVLENPSPLLRPQYDLSHVTRVLFSCLTDADYLDTERFMIPSNYESRKHTKSLHELKVNLDSWLERFLELPKSNLNIIRNDIQKLCKYKASFPPGFFELTVPTGGGKTISSLVWALNHALNYGKERIIIAIPYTSIIIQTAEILRDIFGQENVLEHHSVISEEVMTSENKLMSENWNAPIVVTTNVQLFESMFSNRPGKCRKLHSLCNSVLILDEVQNLPLTFLQPIVNALDVYVRLFKMSVLLSTASQPILSGNRKGLGTNVLNGINSNIFQIIPSSMRLHNRLRRVRIEIISNKISLDSIKERLISLERVLCIVNTRKIANDLYNSLPKDGYLIHLSRMMCPKHIQDKLTLLKQLLSNKFNLPIRVISTQLIEAGVDIDFPNVYRQFSGLDSILQAAGRCNREGKENLATTTVFDLEGHIDRGYQGNASDAMRQLISQNPNCDWLSPDTMNEFYRILYSKTPSFDKENIIGLTDNPTNIAYEKVSERFKLIDDTEINVIVNYGDSPSLIESLKANGPSRNLIKKLGLYTVGIRNKLFRNFYDAGLIEEPVKGFYYIPFKSQYDESTGIKVNNEYVEQTFVI